MRIKVEGDWSGTISFVMAGMAVALLAYFGARATWGNRFSDVVAINLYAMAVCYFMLAAITGVAAYVGREVPDGSSWVTWESTGFDFWGNVMSMMALAMTALGLGAGLPAAKDLASPLLWLCVFAGLLIVTWGVAWLNFGARIMVFTPDKKVLLLKGRPFTFIRKTFKPSDWLGLHVSWQQGYSGGMYRTAPDNLYFVWGVYKGGVIKLNTVNIPQETKRTEGLRLVHELVETTAEKTGLPVPPWPADKDIYLNLWNSGNED